MHKFSSHTHVDSFSISPFLWQLGRWHIPIWCYKTDHCFLVWCMQRLGGSGREPSEANRAVDMSLACLVCHSVESPSHSFRSYSISSAENEGRCSAIANCLARRASLPAPTTTANSSSIIRSSKVMPQPSVPISSGIPGTPRLVRSCAVRRDFVRDWNFEEVVREQ